MTNSFSWVCCYSDTGMYWIDVLLCARTTSLNHLMMMAIVYCLIKEP